MQVQMKPEKRFQVWLLIPMAISSVMEIYKYIYQRPLIEFPWWISVPIWSLSLGCWVALIWYNAQAKYNDNPIRVVVKLVIGIGMVDCILLAALVLLNAPLHAMFVMGIQSSVVFLGLVYYVIKLVAR